MYFGPPGLGEEAADASRARPGPFLPGVEREGGLRRIEVSLQRGGCVGVHYSPALPGLALFCGFPFLCSRFVGAYAFPSGSSSQQFEASSRASWRPAPCGRNDSARLGRARFFNPKLCRTRPGRARPRVAPCTRTKMQQQPPPPPPRSHRRRHGWAWEYIWHVVRVRLLPRTRALTCRKFVCMGSGWKMYSVDICCAHVSKTENPPLTAPAVPRLLSFFSLPFLFSRAAPAAPRILAKISLSLGHRAVKCFSRLTESNKFWSPHAKRFWRQTASTSRGTRPRQFPPLRALPERERAALWEARQKRKRRAGCRPQGGGSAPQRSVSPRGINVASLPSANPVNLPCDGENGSGRGPDADHTIEFKETDADRTRVWPFLPGHG
eukprot:gene20899-biopygen22146